MKRYMKKLLSLLLVLMMAFGTFGEALPVMAAQMSSAQFKKFKPVILSAVEAAPEEDCDRTTKIHYEITMDIPENLNWTSAYVYASDKKNGEYFSVLSEYYTSERGKSNTFFVCLEGFENPKNKTIRYFKVEFQRVSGSNADIETIQTKLSDPVKVSPRKPDNGALELYRISSTMLWIDADPRGLYQRQFQIREMGTSKWEYVSKSKLVKKIEAYKTGYYLTVAKGKEFELRSRYYYTVDGEKLYGKWDYRKTTEVYTPNQPKIINAMQFDAASKDGIALFMEEGYDAYSYYYQVAYRKTGSGSAWKTYTVKGDEMDPNKVEFNPNYEGYVITKRIRVGYDYKVRVAYIVGKRAVYGKYSKTFRVTKSNVKYRHAMDPRLLDVWIYNPDDLPRPTYDTALTRDENLLALRKYLKKTVGMQGTLYYNAGFYPVGGLSFDGDRVGVRMHSDQSTEGAVALESLYFYTGDKEMSDRLFMLQSAAFTFGHADPKYFGFTTVQDYGWVYSGKNSTTGEWYKEKITDGCILDYNGTRVELGQFRETRGNNDNVRLRVFWVAEP